MRFTAILASAGAAAALKQANASLENYTFEMFETEFNKTYSSPIEREIRKAAFAKNLEEIRSLNESYETASFGINKFADWVDEEDQAVFMGRIPTGGSNNKLMASAPETKEEDLSFPWLHNRDWRKAGIMTPVRSQGQCGSCWAFAASAVLEAYHAKETGENVVVAPQQLVDCVVNEKKCGGTGGCHGATEDLAFEWVKTNGGIVAEKDYPYLAKEETCKKDNTAAAVKITNWTQLPSNNVSALKHHVAHIGPVSASVAAGPMKFYTGGVLECPKGKGVNVDINHAVVIVGFGRDEELGDYWIVRNSWGPEWGEEGHVRVRMNSYEDPNFCNIDSTPLHGSACEGDEAPEVVCGHCGIYFETHFVTAQKADEEIRM